MALGVSSTSSRETAVAEDGSGMSNLRKPSCPCVLAFLVIGCTKVRPDEVSASRWSFPAAIDVILHTLMVGGEEDKGKKNKNSECSPLAPRELLRWYDLGVVVLSSRFLAPQPARAPPRCVDGLRPSHICYTRRYHVYLPRS